MVYSTENLLSKSGLEKLLNEVSLKELSRETGVSYDTLRNYKSGKTSLDGIPYGTLMALSEYARNDLNGLDDIYGGIVVTDEVYHELINFVDDRVNGTHGSLQSELAVIDELMNHAYTTKVNQMYDDDYTEQRKWFIIREDDFESNNLGTTVSVARATIGKFNWIISESMLNRIKSDENSSILGKVLINSLGAPADGDSDKVFRIFGREIVSVIKDEYFNPIIPLDDESSFYLELMGRLCKEWYRGWEQEMLMERIREMSDDASVLASFLVGLRAQHLVDWFAKNVGNDTFGSIQRNLFENFTRRFYDTVIRAHDTFERANFIVSDDVFDEAVALYKIKQDLTLGRKFYEDSYFVAYGWRLAYSLNKSSGVFDNHRIYRIANWGFLPDAQDLNVYGIMRESQWLRLKSEKSASLDGVVARRINCGPEFILRLLWNHEMTEVLEAASDGLAGLHNVLWAYRYFYSNEPEDLAVFKKLDGVNKDFRVDDWKSLLRLACSAVSVRTVVSVTLSVAYDKLVKKGVLTESEFDFLVDAYSWVIECLVC